MMLALTLAGGACLCQTADKFRHYDELPFWEQPDRGEWASVRGLNVSWGSVDSRYARHQVPSLKERKSLVLEGWRGERVFAQAVVWTESSAEISFSLSDLAGRGGAVIPASSCESGFVRYTKTEKLPVITDGCYHGYTGEAAWQYDSTMVADCIDPFMEKDNMPAMSARAIWITIPIPSTDYVGDYRGHLDIYSSGRKVERLSLTVRANHRILPPPSEWHYHLDLWQNVFSIARDYGVKPFSEDFYTMVRPYLQRLASAGQKAITAPILHAPWGENPGSAGNFLSLITWVKRLDGNWEFDYTIFDKYVQFAMDCGITGQISCYTLAPWSYSYRYLDIASGTNKNIILRPENKDCEQVLSVFVKDFAAHLRSKGWFEKAAIAFDERPLEDMQNIIRIIHGAEPEFKISQAGFEYMPEIDTSVYDYSLASYKDFPEGRTDARRAEGKKSTYYICCPEIRPNRYVFSEPWESAYIAYNMAVRGADGFLCWAVFHWMGNPLLDARWSNYWAGELFMLYPGNRSSLRFERMIDGIQDYEKMRIFRDTAAPDQVARLDVALDSFRKTLKVKDRYNIENRSYVPEAIAKVKKILLEK